MSELPPDEPSITAPGADSSRREAAAQEARSAQTFAVSAEPTPTPISVSAGESQVLRAWHPFIENPKPGTA
jgi:hypothetical protein